MLTFASLGWGPNVQQGLLLLLLLLLLRWRRRHVRPAIHHPGPGAPLARHLLQGSVARPWRGPGPWGPAGDTMTMITKKLKRVGLRVRGVCWCAAARGGYLRQGQGLVPEPACSVGPYRTPARRACGQHPGDKGARNETKDSARCYQKPAPPHPTLPAWI